MFERPHHRRIARVLAALDANLLAEAHCYFGGGTAIVLQLGEYRESVDIDFLCADPIGYRKLRETVTSHTLGRILRTPLAYARDIRTQRDKISTFLSVDDVPIRIEFVLEGRIAITGQQDARLGVPTLSRDDMYAEKLLANADRALDRSQRSRDLIDLAFMIRNWGPIPAGALAKANEAYGETIRRSFDQGLDMLRERRYRDACLTAMSIPTAAGDDIVATLGNHAPS
ncbi:nucleotidyl transferase AbiEii/AbiGii toxin family protein [Luteimonas sp. BDR2-5]|uniref:nucleotidyl transferase AbiEii/AbiGii toxin family protein n=1 Tax=Proluteimonas luteida TaxID=2878685 RepID=UPI001E405CEB|nr:nucleotidyl transferase AbiEii/AbiGii toxin family protein [Luteimonas sp. BDR2-5]MCD9027033.1 nucleotidyl transferase AbiEii/AbiGii toxin family protein [Luteimonas sp. BDR2-5]